MENRCKFWLPKKNRFCANAPLNNSLFCGNHIPRSDAQWIPCPIDPSHSVLQDNIEGHIKRCPLLKQVQSLSSQPFYQKGINSGEEGGEALAPAGTQDNVSSEMKRIAVYGMTVPHFFELIRKIESVHGLICKGIIESYKMPEACSMWIKREEEGRKLPFQEKHVMQQASILGNLEDFEVLKSSVSGKHCESDEPARKSNDNGNIPAVVEFGAGRGYLTQMLADCYGIRKVFLVERKSYKLKADRSLRQKESMTLERLRIDIEDLNLNAVESLQGLPYIAMGKHLCGPAADKKYLTSLGISKEEFHAITWFTSWAVDADHTSDFSDVTDCRLSLESIKNVECRADASGVEGIVRNMKATERAMLGFVCKQIIDMGRLMWLKEHKLETKFVKYVPSTVSPENHLLIARSVHSL